MGQAIKYFDGQAVLVGDKVEIKRPFRFRKNGTVIYVYDPEQPVGPNGQNDYGVSIKLENGHVLFGVPQKDTALVHRAE